VDIDIQAKIFKALGNETRLQILYKILRVPLVCSDGQGACVGKIADEFQFSLPTISRHLKELKEANLIVMNKIGNKIYVEPNRTTLSQIAVFLEEKF
jgi:ArsR family transcriptional regulator